MKLLWTIQEADVGMGVYRHPFRSDERSILVRIAGTFGGIMRVDVGKTVWVDTRGRLELRHKEGK